MQRRPALVVLRIDVGIVLGEELDHVDVGVDARLVESGEAVDVGRVYVDAHLQMLTHFIYVRARARRQEYASFGKANLARYVIDVRRSVFAVGAVRGRIVLIVAATTAAAAAGAVVVCGRRRLFNMFLSLFPVAELFFSLLLLQRACFFGKHCKRLPSFLYSYIVSSIWSMLVV